MFFASAFQAGQLVGFLVLVVVGVGLVRTFSRNDLTWKQKLFGTSKDADQQPKV